MLRHIFSLKLVVLFALVAFLGSVSKPADARHRVKYPCPFTVLYATSKTQARLLGYTNNVESCNILPDGGIELFTELTTCSNHMFVADLETDPVCGYNIGCESDPGYLFKNTELLSGPSAPVLTPEEVKACRAELKTIALLSGIHCQQADDM